MTGFFFWDWLKHDHDSHGSGGSTPTTPTPAPDGYVEGTNGADTIGAGYTDSDGDKIDSNDALLPGEMGDDDIVIAGDGADVVHSGQGNDEVYGGGAGDTVYGGQGNDVIYGDESRDSAPGGSSVTKSYDCKDLISTSCDGSKWFDWGHLSFDKLSHKHAWDQKLTFELDKSVLLKGLVFDDAHLGAKVKITAEDGKILFEGQVNTQADAYTLDLNIDAAAKIELWTNGSCQVTQIDYHEGGFDGLDAGVPGADSLEGGSGDDTIFGNEENDTIKGDEGNDVLYGNEGDDSVEGGQGDDLIFGDNGAPSGPGTPGGSGERESFEWDKAPDPNGSGGIDNQDDISGGFTQNTGSVDVNFSVVTSNKSPETRFETDTQKVHSINTGGAEADKSSSMASHLNSTGESATYAWDFSSSVGNVSFRINDIDADSKVIIKAIGPDGILTEIDVQAEWGTHLTLTDADGIGGKEVVTHSGSDLAPDDSPAHSVLVNIPGPVAQLQVTHVQNGDHTSEINVTDIYFDALEDTGGIGGGDDVAGDDTLLGGSGDDTIYGNMGDDSIEGGAGADLIYGDNGDMDAGGSDDGPRESFNWQPVSQGQADSTVTQNTGSVDVTYTRIKDTGRHESEIDNNADLNTSGIDTGGETIDGNSGLKSQTKGDGNEGDFQWEFSQPVTNVDFNINDLDTNGVVTVKAWDADGNPIEVTLTGGSGMSLSDTDAVAGADQARSNVGDLSSDSDANNLQVSIAGPVSKIVVEHAQDGATNSGIYITDLYFNVPDMTGNPDFDGQGGDDTLAGGEGADTIYGEGGDDTFVVRSADEGAGDQIIGGNGPVEIFDHDVLDLRGAGPVTIDKVMDDTDAQSYKGTVTFADGRTLEFSQIEEILFDEDPVNEAPVAGNDAAEGDEDTVITIDVLANDSDPDGDALTVTDVTDPANGSIEIVDGKLVYTPDADFNGTDTVTYTVTDSEGNTDTATVTITVNPVNDAPVANDDAVNTPEDQPVTFDPLANDTDVDGDELSIVGTPVSANGGEVVVNPDGSVTYTPPTDFNGTDTITYTVTDPDGLTDTATITVTVGPVADAPVAEDDLGSGDEDTVITIDVLENDSDPDGDALTVTDVTDPANGSIEIVDGKLVYTPDADFNGTDTVTYTVTDSEGNTDTATVTITVNPVNDAPVANDDAVNTPEDQPVTFDPLANDTDVDGDELSIVGTPVSANGGEVVVNPDGSVTYTPPTDFNGTDTITYTVTDPDGLTDTATITVTVGPVADAPVAEDDLGSGDEDTVITIDVLENDSDPDGDALTVTDVTDPANGSIEIVDGKLVYTPDADFNGTDTVTYTVTDSEGNTDTATVTITVNPVNDAPVANDDAVNTPEDQPVTFDPLANDTDVDGDELSIVGTPVSANGGEVVVNPDGSVTYTPPTDFNGTDTITYTVTDPDGLTDTATITVTVGPVADAPVAEDDLGSGDEDTVITIDVLENDSDPDGDALTVTDVTDPANGSIEIVDGKLVYTPDADFNGTDTVTYTVTDSEGNTDTATVTITVNPVNDAPVAEDDADMTDVVTPVTIDVLANDSDVDGDALTVTSVEDPANGSAAIVDGKIVYTPDAGFTGTETFTYTITDEDGLTDTATVTVKVEDGNGGNQDPVAVDDLAETDEDTAVTINALENDSDPQNDPLTITDASDTPNGTVQVIGNQIVYTPDENFNGTETITYTVTDTDGNTDTATVTVKVNPVNDAPVAEDDADTTDVVTPVTIDVLANDSDVDGDALTVTSVEDPANGSAAIVDGKIVYTPDAGFTGTETFTYTITDEDGLTDTATVTVKVEDGTGGNQDPVAVDDLAETDEDTAVTINALENDSDPQNDPLTITDASDTPNGTVQVIGNQIVYTPDENFNGTETITYTVTDTDGNTDTATVTVKVNPVNDAPVAEDDADTTDVVTPVTIDVLANDSDVDGDALTVTSVEDPANGSAAIVDGKIVYTPDAGFTGTETFTYTITDEDGLTDTATVTVKVEDGNGGNQDPVAVDDTAETDEDTAVTINALENDSDPQNDPLTITDASDTPNGTVQVIGNQIVYTPDENFNGTETITYTVTDTDGNTDTATVTVKVNPVNDAPVAEDDADTTDIVTPVTIDVLANDSDVDGDALTVTSVEDPANGTAAIVDGKIVYTPDAGFTGTETFTYTITDEDGLTDTATVTVKVEDGNGGNQDPVAVDDLAETDEDTAVTINALENDSDPQNDPLTITDASDTPNGTVQVVGNQIVYTPDENFNGTETITYTVTDPDGNTDTATVTVKVNPVNDAPVAEDDADTTDVVTPVTIDVLANDSDVDGDALTVTSVADPANGSAAIVDGKIVYTPDAGFTGTETFTYTITDEDGLTDTATITVTVEEDTGPDGIVEGHSGDDLIDDDYEGDPEGDKVDNEDALDPTSGDDDIIEAYSGDDTVIAGSGDDTVDGGPGNDSIYGNSGDDSITSGPDGLPDVEIFPGTPVDSDPYDDRDTVYGNQGDDTIRTGDDQDVVYGGSGDDDLNAGIDDDKVYGGRGDDLINDPQGSDYIEGGSGDDTIIAGIDTFSDYEGDDPNLPNALYPGILSDPNPDDGKDTVYGGQGNDVIMTGDDADSIRGGSGDDTINGGIDDDYIEGNRGKDSIIGGHGSDTIYGNSGDDWINAGDSTLLWGQSPDDDPVNPDPVPENGRDLVYGGDGNDTIFGQDDDDTLYGGVGNDVIDGGIDDDEIYGESGNDTLMGGQGDDTVGGGTGADSIDGNSGDDSLTGGQGDDTITGGAGDDTLRGNTGADSLTGGSGDDVIDGGGQNDTIIGGEGADTMFGGSNDEDLFIGSTVGDVIDGGSGTTVDYDVLDLRGSAPTGGRINVIYDDNPENGTVEFYDADDKLVGTSQFEEIEKVIPCFTPGTLIATPRGEVPVETLREGDRVITRDNGIQEIRWFGHKDLMGRELLQKEHLKPVLIQKGSLGYGLPERDMLVSPNHRVLVNNDKTALYFEEREVLVAAKHLTGLAGVNRVDTMKTQYIHFMFDQHEVILSDGSWTESFQPGHQTLDGLGNAQRQEILELFPELATEAGREDYHAARRTLKKHEAKLLIK